MRESGPECRELIGQKIDLINEELQKGDLNTPPTSISVGVAFGEDEPGMQIYDGYYLPVRNSGIALETQHFPDSPNKPMFPNTILRPGQVLYSTTEFRFKTV